MRLVIYALKKGISLKDIKMSVFGLAGVDTKIQHKTISDIIRRIGMHDFVLCNDSYLGIKAGAKTGYGICANNGTGFTVSAIDSDNNVLQIGGLGDITGDIGGGSNMAVKAVCKVYEQLYKLGKPTVLKDMIFNEYNITDKADFTEIITQKLDDDNYNTVLTLAKYLYEAANLGDEVALSVLDEVGTDYGKCICGAVNDMNLSDYCEIIMTGSQFIKGSNKHAIDTMQEFVKEP